MNTNLRVPDFAPVNRRQAIRFLTHATTALFLSSSLLKAETVRSRLGVGMHSYGAAWKAGKEKNPAARFHDALSFLEYCHEMGAAGVQVSVGTGENSHAQTIRHKCEEFQMYLEAQTTLPRDEADSKRFEEEIRFAREAGATVMRTACLSGRRYETFDTLEAFEKFRENSWRSITLAEPIVKKHQMRLAIENHKDWLIEEFTGMMRRLSSEHVGITVDIGNSIALAEDPYEVVEALAPWAVSTHIKDMAVAEYAEGFLLSEVPLGEGFLDLGRMVNILRKANPKIRWNLEMITRDPLHVPCLTEKYWSTMPSASASRLARVLTLVRKNKCPQALPATSQLSFEETLREEDKNVRLCLHDAATFGI